MSGYCGVCDRDEPNPRATCCSICGEPLGSTSFALEPESPNLETSARNPCRLVIGAVRCPLEASVSDNVRGLDWCSLHSTDSKRRAETEDGLRDLRRDPAPRLRRERSTSSAADPVMARADEIAELQPGETRADMIERARREALRLGYGRRGGLVGKKRGGGEGPREVVPKAGAARGAFCERVSAALRARLAADGFSPEQAEILAAIVREELERELGIAA